MYSTKLSVAVHILSLIDMSDNKPITSEWIAGSINTNAVVVRKIMRLLKKEGIINSKRGSSLSTLAKAPKDISLLEIYRAVEPRDELFDIHQNTNPKCVVGANIQKSLDEHFCLVKTKMERELAVYTLEDILKSIEKNNNLKDRS